MSEIQIDIEIRKLIVSNCEVNGRPLPHLRGRVNCLKVTVVLLL